ncbi:MAG: lactonase family protein [Planctomycetaceae bacterium]|nr:lactonase family protein [Planctomycetaceae bacterium]
MIKFVYLVLLMTCLSQLPCLADENETAKRYWVYLGTYTSESGSQGIYRCILDPATGEVSAPELAAELGSPSFIHISADGQSLYAIGESMEEGGVYSFKLDQKTGKLSDQVTLTSGGATACHISTDQKNQFAVVSNYFGGSYSFFKLKPNGSLESRIAHHAIPVIKIDGADREARGHCGFFDATGTLAFTCDAGQDKVHIYKLNREQGTVTPNDPPYLAMPALSAPRHIHIAPDNSVAFVNGERDMTVNLVKLDVAGNQFEVIQSLSTLREGEKVEAGYSTAECRIHPSGKFVYVSNRGHNTIAAFKYDANVKKLSPVGHITGDIKIPRNFNITPCGQWMLIASQDGGKVGVYKIDTTTGLATETKHSIKIDQCVCIKFLEQ